MRNNLLWLLSLLLILTIQNGLGSRDDELDDDETFKDLYDSLKNDKELEDLLEDYFLERNKKNKDHGQQQAAAATSDGKSCFESMHVSDNKITHTKKSIDNGAELIDVKYVPTTTPDIVIHESCMQLCCDTKACDTGLLSLKSSAEGYKCYLFNCSNRCVFDDHRDYSVMSKYVIGEVKQTTTVKVADVPNKPKATTTTSATTIAAPVVTDKIKTPIVQQDDNDESVMSGTTMAIVLLVIGTSLTVALFVYFVVNTSYVNRRFRWPNLKYKNTKAAAKSNASVNDGEAESDYLINGMYL